jgi:hypothetical protein
MTYGSSASRLASWANWATGPTPQRRQQQQPVGPRSTTACLGFLKPAIDLEQRAAGCRRVCSWHSVRRTTAGPSAASDAHHVHDGQPAKATFQPSRCHAIVVGTPSEGVRGCSWAGRRLQGAGRTGVKHGACLGSYCLCRRCPWPTGSVSHPSSRQGRHCQGSGHGDRT